MVWVLHKGNLTQTKHLLLSIILIGNIKVKHAKLGMLTTTWTKIQRWVLFPINNTTNNKVSCFNEEMWNAWWQVTTATVTTAMNCNQPKQVDMKLAALDEAVIWFCEVHNMYHKTLKYNDDLDASKGYLTSVLCDVQSWSGLRTLSNQWRSQTQRLKMCLMSKSAIGLLSTQLHELHNLRQKERESIFVHIAQKGECLWTEFKFQRIGSRWTENLNET